MIDSMSSNRSDQVIVTPHIGVPGVDTSVYDLWCHPPYGLDYYNTAGCPSYQTDEWFLKGAMHTLNKSAGSED